MLGYIPQERIDFLQKLNKEKRIFLLSNTNEIHLKEVNKRIKSGNGISDFPSLFEKAYFSNLMGMRKPNTEIFDFVVSENKLIKSETLFIDDTLQHIEGAKRAGLNIHLLKKDASIIELF